MKYFQIPSPIQLKDAFTDAVGATVTFQQIAALWLNDPLWADPKPNLASLVVIVAELKKAPLEWVALENADHALLVRAVSAKSPQPPLVQLQLAPFDDAVLKAVDAKPEGV